MHTDAVLSYARLMAIEEFQNQLSKARQGFLFRRLFAKRGELEHFGNRMAELDPARHYRGLMEIPIERIVGSVDRGSDFDRDFRPLAPHLRDRWISVYLLAGETGWPAIRVLKAGEQYYVEDGHNRVSVARRIGMQAIQAEVWEYDFKPQPKPVLPCARNYCDLPLAEC